jgi:hypothetical protein
MFLMSEFKCQIYDEAAPRYISAIVGVPVSEFDDTGLVEYEPQTEEYTRYVAKMIDKNLFPHLFYRPHALFEKTGDEYRVWIALEGELYSTKCTKSDFEYAHETLSIVRHRSPTWTDIDQNLSDVRISDLFKYALELIRK